LCEFALSRSALRDKYLTQRRIFKLFTFLSKHHQGKFIQNKASPKFKQNLRRPIKPHVTAVPEMVTTEAEAL
jgi:hypothetical protein